MSDITNSRLFRPLTIQQKKIIEEIGYMEYPITIERIIEREKIYLQKLNEANKFITDHDNLFYQLEKP